METIQNLYQIYKIPSTKIVENNMCITNYTKRKAVKEGCLVSIGDNLVFHKIRNYYGDLRTHEEIFFQIKELRKVLKLCKKEGKIQEAKIINQNIREVLFVQDLVNIEVMKKKEYKEIAKNGFDLNGIHYVRFCCGTGALRRNTITFINEKLYNYMYVSLMCGLEKKIDTINVAKLNAYFALAFSSVLWVRTPNVCVIKDFETIIPQQKIDWIFKGADGNNQIEERIMDVPLNSADGQGLVDPAFSCLWAQDMYLDFVPSSFVVRSVFIKGNLVPFDFKEYARRENISTIKDKWGKEYNIDEIDVILSESQFKMHKIYDSWQEYTTQTFNNDIKWGVARYNKKIDDEYVLSNYQYLQCLNISQEEIKELIRPTVDWLTTICTGGTLETLLFLFGKKNNFPAYEDIYGSAQTLFTKAIIKNNDFLKDSFVRKKIYNNITESINKAKIGKIWLRGNYQFMISDPVAQCRSALGLEPNGLIPADHVYSKFWSDRSLEGCVDLCRSPMIDDHEHNPSKIYDSNEANYWYQYIKSGIIYSIYDTAVCRHEDSDLTFRSIIL